MKKRLFPLLIALAALSVSGSAAFYSVFGLSKLFAGASLQVIIMAGSLEFAKLVVASLLYQYWDTINKVLRAYLAIACFVLMVITSGGIYGFLSGAYQSTATQSELLDKSLVILNQKQVRFEEQKEDLKLEKAALTTSISDLRIALSNPAQVQYVDKESGQLITTSSSSARRALQSELKTTIAERDGINIKIEAVMDSINKTDMALLDKEVSNEAESELGPLKYLAETTGYPMNEVVNWFLLLIIFVFDPLAIALVVAANMAFAQIKRKEPEVKMSVPDGLEFNKPYTLDEINQSFSKEEENYFEDLEEYLHTKEEENLTYPEFVEKHYPETKKETSRVIKSEKDLDDDELEELSKEVGRNEIKVEEKPINPTEEDLEKLANILNIEYSEDNIPLERLTDTTQTLVTKIDEDKENDETNEDSKTTLRYRGRKL
jgi:hypothetical protein